MTSQEVLLKYVKTSSGEFKILDDSVITSSCIDAYTECVTQITKIVGGGGINK
jgi:hypothetical protein